MPNTKKRTLKIILILCLVLLCIVFLIIAIVPYANGEIKAWENNFSDSTSEAYKYRQKADDAYKEYTDMSSRAGVYRFTHSAAEYAKYENEMNRYKRLWEANKELASIYDLDSYYFLAELNSAKNQSAVCLIVSAVFFLGAVGAFVWLRMPQKKTAPLDNEQECLAQEFYCPQCKNPVHFGEPTCKTCGMQFDWSKQ